VECAGCGQAFAAPTQLAGKRVACPQCRAVLAIPKPIAPKQSSAATAPMALRAEEPLKTDLGEATDPFNQSPPGGSMRRRTATAKKRRGKPRMGLMTERVLPGFLSMYLTLLKQSWLAMGLTAASLLSLFSGLFAFMSYGAGLTRIVSGMVGLAVSVLLALFLNLDRDSSLRTIDRLLGQVFCVLAFVVSSIKAVAAVGTTSVRGDTVTAADAAVAITGLFIVIAIPFAISSLVGCLRVASFGGIFYLLAISLFSSEKHKAVSPLQTHDSDYAAAAGELPVDSRPTVSERSPVRSSSILPRPEWRQFDAGILAADVRLTTQVERDTTTLLMAYLPTSNNTPRSLPCVFVGSAGAMELTGNRLGEESRAEHLPYVRAGFAVVAFEIDGMIPEGEFFTSDDLRRAFAEFRAARGGVVNVEKAMEFAEKMMPQTDPKRYFVAGHSSAGTAALLAAAELNAVRGCLAYAPVSKLGDRIDADARRAYESAIQHVDKEFRRYSPFYRDFQGKNIFLFHSKQDEIVAYQQSEELRSKLAQKGVKVQLASQGSGHYDSMIEYGIPQGIRWLQEQLGSSSSDDARHRAAVAAFNKNRQQLRQLVDRVRSDFPNLMDTVKAYSRNVDSATRGFNINDIDTQSLDRLNAQVSQQLKMFESQLALLTPIAPQRSSDHGQSQVAGPAIQSSGTAKSLEGTISSNSNDGNMPKRGAATNPAMPDPAAATALLASNPSDVRAALISRLHKLFDDDDLPRSGEMKWWVGGKRIVPGLRIGVGLQMIGNEPVPTVGNVSDWNREAGVLGRTIWTQLNDRAGLGQFGEWQAYRDVNQGSVLLVGAGSGSELIAQAKERLLDGLVLVQKSTRTAGFRRSTSDAYRVVVMDLHGLTDRYVSDEIPEQRLTAKPEAVSELSTNVMSHIDQCFVLGELPEFSSQQIDERIRQLRSTPENPVLMAAELTSYRQRQLINDLTLQLSFSKWFGDEIAADLLSSNTTTRQRAWEQLAATAASQANQ
jgi:dienelactone hydrolase